MGEKQFKDLYIIQGRVFSHSFKWEIIQPSLEIAYLFAQITFKIYSRRFKWIVEEYLAS